MGAERHRQEQQEWQEEAWRLRIEGYTQARIAEHLGVSQQRVSQILQRTEKKLYAEFVKYAEQTKITQSERLDHLYFRLTEQFEQSCDGQSGNPALLAQAIKALADQRQIWGLNSPEKREVSGPAGGPIQVTEIVVELPREVDHED